MHCQECTPQSTSLLKKQCSYMKEDGHRIFAHLCMGVAAICGGTGLGH